MIISPKGKRPDRIVNQGGESIQEIIGTHCGNAKSHSVAEVMLEKGQSSDAHFHKHSEETYLILSGSGRLHLDQHTIHLEPGDAVLIQPNEIHQIFNDNQKTLRFLAICVPAWHPDDSHPAKTYQNTSHSTGQQT